MPSIPPTSHAFHRLNREDIDPLLSHLDAQEAAMVALKSLLMDLPTEPADDTRRRNLRTRIDAASELCTRLNHDCALLLRQLAAKCSVEPQHLLIRHLIDAFQVRAPDVAVSLRNARQRIARLGWQIQRTSSTSAWILAEDRSIRHAAFECAAGSSDPDRYDASGKKSISSAALRYGARS